MRYRSEGWNYLPIHTKCGKMVSREQLVEFFRPTGLSPEDQLMRQGRYAEVFLTNWSLIEISVDECVAYLFGYATTDNEADLLNEIPFGRKLSYLKDWGVFSSEDFDSVKSLQTKRNQVVHSYARELKSTDFRQMAQQARKVAWIVNMAALRVLYNNKPLLEYVTQGDIEVFGPWPPPLPSQTKFGRRREPPKAPPTESDADVNGSRGMPKS